MGLITNKTNPWGDDAKHFAAKASLAYPRFEDGFYIVATPESEEERELCVVAKDRQSARVLAALLTQLALSMTRELDKEDEANGTSATS